MTITGTPADDSITISKVSGGHIVTIDGVQKTYVQTVNSIVVNANGGGDTVTLKDNVLVPATLNGGDGDDKLRGGGGNDSLNGDVGNDTIDGGKGGDLLKGGAGIDTVDYSSRTQKLTIGVGVLYDDGEANEKDNVQADIEVFQGGSAGDSIKGGIAHESIFGNGGNDTIYGQNGNDFISGGMGNDYVDGGAGNDQMNGSFGRDTLVGGFGNDIANGGDDDDRLIGGLVSGVNVTPDKDLLLGGEGNDLIDGGVDNDSVFGGGGNDILDGGDGNDELMADDGDDVVRGGKGNDSLNGGLDNDTLEGGAGVDFMHGADGDDKLTDEGVAPPNDDEVDVVPDENAPIIVPAVLIGGSGNDSIVAGAGSSILQGEDGDDTLVGNAGHDILDGGLGDDSLEGKGGRDTLTGGYGFDAMLGGDGNDVFVNNEGQADFIDGGEDIDTSQPEESFQDIFTNVEGRYDQVEGDPIIVDDPFPEPPEAIMTVAKGTIAAPATAPPVIEPGGLLHILGGTDANGGALNDVIQVTQNATTIDVTINTVTYHFPVASVLKVVVECGAGKDRVLLELSSGKSPLTRPSTVSGGPGNDTLRGGAGVDLIVGGDGNDSLSGGANNDIVQGGNGNDYVSGGSPAIFGHDGVDDLSGGAGAGDYVDYTFRTDKLVVTLDGKANDGVAGENDFLRGDVEGILGGRGDDLLIGNAGANLLSGGAGADTLKGGGGNDNLQAGYTFDTKIDKVFGNLGYDYLYMEDKVRDEYNASASTDFFRLEVGSNGLALDVLVADQA